jgi:hypothetical protein
MVTIGARTVATTGATGAEADGRTAARSLQIGI